MATPPTKLEILHTYRRLYRSLLNGVAYAKPARFIVRDQLRAAFREPPKPAAVSGTRAANADSAAPSAVPAQWNREHIERTIWFCEAAAKERGMEHKVLKNLVKVKLAQVRDAKYWRRVFVEHRKKNIYKARDSDVYHHYNMTVAMLNKSMGLCLR